MKPVDDASRVRLFRVSAGLCAASLLLAPLAGRSSLELRAEEDAFDRPMSVPQPALQRLPDVTLTRDPFRQPAREGGASRHAPDASGGVATVRAIVTGPDPIALVDDGRTTRIVRAGDTVGGRLIVAIDEGGVHFDASALQTTAAERP